MNHMSMTTPDRAPDAPDTVFPPSDTGQVVALAKFLGTHRGTAQLTSPDGSTVNLPDEVFQVLTRVVAAMKNGKAITLAPVSRRLTTSQAAEMLGISRPTLIKLLDEHEIPYEQPGRHRRIRLDDMLAYRDRRRHERRSILDEMTRQAVQDGMYDTSAEDYTQALHEARTEH